MFSDFNRSLFGNAPAYPSGVVGGPYALPDIAPQQAQDPFSGGGPFPYTREDRFADAGLPPEITRGASSSGGGGGDNRFMLPDVTNQDRTFTLFDSPNARDAMTLGGLGGGGAGAFQRPASSGSGSDNIPLLATQRSGYADTIRNDPNRALQLAARLNSEDQNNPNTRVAILEAMLNAYNATGRDPLDPRYYPKNQKQYNDAMTRVSNDNDLLNRINQEMERAFGGSNLSNFATDWASGNLATTMRDYATPTWTSPSNEQFFRKDFSANTGSRYDTGAGDAARIQRWYESLSGLPR